MSSQIRECCVWLCGVLAVFLCLVVEGDTAQTIDESMKCVCKSTHYEDPSFSITCRRSFKDTFNTQDKHQWNSNNIVEIQDSSLVCKKDKGPPPSSEYDTLFNSRYYKLHTKLADWEGALRTCAREGANLAIINSDAEAQVLVNLFELYPSIDKRDWVNYQGWIGANDLQTEGEFVTITGEPLENVWAKWSVDEPNDREGKEDCIAFLRDGTINDLKCEYQLPFFCERSYGS